MRDIGQIRAARLLTFPIPVLTFLLATAAGFAVFRQDVGPRLARGLFLGFFFSVAVGSLMVGLRFGYGIETFVPIQRALPLLGGPLLYLGFAVLSVSRIYAVRLVAVHLGITLALALFVPIVGRSWEGVDLLIPISFCVYALSLVLLRRKGANALTRARLEAVPALLRMMVVGAAFLLLFGLVDSAISISFALERRDDAMALISGASVVLMVVMSAVIFLSGRSFSGQGVTTMPLEVDHAGVAQDAEAFLVKTQLYLDTDLTVERLAKRLHVPARTLSSAINNREGINVSQYVNGFRLRHAAQLLETTDLTDISQVVWCCVDLVGFRR